RRLLGEAALEERRDAAGELDHLEPAGDLAHGVREDLAVLRREHAGEVLAMVVDELADPEEELRAARQRNRSPGREGSLRRGDRGADLLDRGEVDLGGLPAGGRVVHG